MLKHLSNLLHLRITNGRDRGGRRYQAFARKFVARKYEKAGQENRRADHAGLHFKAKPSRTISGFEPALLMLPSSIHHIQDESIFAKSGTE